jgi:hypothetical protein
MPVVNVPQNDRYDPSLSLLMFFHSTLHFDVVAIVRSYEIWTNEQQDDVCTVKVSINLALPFLTSADLPIVPRVDNSISLENHKVSLELIAKGFVLV